MNTDMDNTAAFLRRYTLDFFQKTRLTERFPPRSRPVVVETTVREATRAWKLDISDEVYEKCIVVGLDMGYASYQHAPHALQIAVALVTFCATMFDEAVVGDVQAMREFCPRLCTGQPQLHPILTRFVEAGGVLREFLPDYTANMVYPCLMAFANEELFCWGGANEVTLHPEGANYIDYSRFKSGLPEAFVVCIWPRSMFPDVSEYVQALPDAVLFIDYVNDFLSYYKEALEDDKHCYINRYMQVYGMTMEEAVHAVVEKTVASLERVRKILGQGRAREAWEDFASGYIYFHLYCPRYRMKELVPEYY